MSHRAAALMALLVAALVAVAPSANADVDDLRAERERVRAAEARAAADVDALEVEATELGDALDTVRAHVGRQQEEVAAARQRVSDSEAEVQAAEATLATIRTEQDATRVDIQELVVRAYVADDPGSGSGASLLGFDDLTTVDRERAYVDAQFGNLDDLRELLRALEEDADDARIQREAALAEAEEQRAVEAEELTDLEEAEALQADLVTSAEERLDQRLAEAATLAERDAGLSQQITNEEAAIARRLAAERERQARARAAASSSSSPSPSGGSSGGGSAAPITTVGSGEIVSVGGISIHRSIAGNLESLLSAARGSGINLSGWGYRSSQRQVELRRSHCGSSNYAIYQAPSSSCRPPTARPGSSMHERGLAVDFTYGGSSISSRSNAGYRWLANNASRFGFYNLPSEPWHWSTTGR